jgi:hypothetical protein
MFQKSLLRASGAGTLCEHAGVFLRKRSLVSLLAFALRSLLALVLLVVRVEETTLGFLVVGCLADYAVQLGSGSGICWRTIVVKSWQRRQLCRLIALSLVVGLAFGLSSALAIFRWHVELVLELGWCLVSNLHISVQRGAEAHYLCDN